MIKPNYFYSILSVALVLFLLGFFGICVLFTNEIVKSLKEKVNIMVEMKDSISSNDLAAFEKNLQQKPFIKTGSLLFTDKEKAAEELKSEFGNNFLLSDMENPLKDVFSFNINSNYFDKDSLMTIKTKMKENPMVYDIYFQANVLSNITNNLKNYGYFAMGLSILFILIAISLIHHYIKLALYANRFLIKNMELVGASWGFIKKPYLIKSISHGFMSAFLAIIMLGVLAYLLLRQNPTLLVYINTYYLLLLSGCLIALGVLINFFGTYIVVNRYLKSNINDLY
jgi:cell division transport system permease protein